MTTSGGDSQRPQLERDSPGRGAGGRRGVGSVDSSLSATLPTTHTLANTPRSSVWPSGPGWGFTSAAPPRGGAPNSRRRRAGWGARDPHTRDQSAPAGGGPHSAPPTQPGALGERHFLCPFVSSWGGPRIPRPPLQRGAPDWPALVPRRRPSPRPGRARSSLGRAELAGTGAPKVRRPERGTGGGARRAGAPRQPRCPPLGLGPRPPPCHPRAPNRTPTWARIQLPAAQPRAPLLCLLRPPQDKIHTRCGAHRTPIYSCPCRPPGDDQGPQLRCH
jgi:hypothetical protein